MVIRGIVKSSNSKTAGRVTRVPDKGRSSNDAFHDETSSTTNHDARAVAPLARNGVEPEKPSHDVETECFPKAVGDWDDLDMLAFGSTPGRFAPEVKRVREQMIAIYARYSSTGQKSTSIVYQERRSVRYYKAKGLGVSHTLYADEALTATDDKRPRLQDLLRDILAGRITIVIFFKFDRVSREAFDGVPIIKACIQRKVQMHCAFSDRHLTKMEAIRESLAAEEDNSLRTERMKEGLTLLVEVENGIPIGEYYGVDRTLNAGHPKINDKEAEVVLRIVRDVVYKSTAEVAKELTYEGVPAPGGGTIWLPSTVNDIATHMRNTGNIRYRVQCVDRDEDGNRVMVNNKLENIVKGYASELRMVSDDEYRAAVRAVRGRNRKSGVIVMNTDNRAVSVFGNPGCDCGVDGQRYNLQYTGEANFSHRYSCGAQASFQCENRVRSLRADVVEVAIFDLVVPFLSKKLTGFGAKLVEQLAAINRTNEWKRKSYTEDLSKAQRRSDRFVAKISMSEFDDDSAEKAASALRVQIADLREKIEAIPHVPVDDVDWDGVTRTLTDAFEMIRDRLPFVPTHANEVELVQKLREGVVGITVSDKGRLPGSYLLSVTMQWQRYFLRPDQMKACGFEAETVSVEFCLPHWFGKNTGSQQYFSEMAEKGLHALTDEQWDLVKDDLPDMTSSERGSIHLFDTRSIVHCLLFVTKTGIPLRSAPRFFGEPLAVYFGMIRLVAQGGIETLTDKIGHSDPEWLAGFDFSRFGRLKRLKDSKRQPARSAARFAETGRYDLSDEQWNAIEHLFTSDVYIFHQGAVFPGIGMRAVMNGILIKLRSKCSWKMLPPKFGEAKDFRSLVHRIVYAGQWQSALDILSRYPDVVAGLDTDVLKTFTKAYHRRYQDEPVAVAGARTDRKRKRIRTSQ